MIETLAAGSEGDGDRRLVGADRVLAVLTLLAQEPDGIALEEMTRRVDSPKSTVHRALGALRRADFATQDDHGRYFLGDAFLRLAFAHHQGRPDHVRIQPVLEALATRFGETAHYAVLLDQSVVYRSKMDPPREAVRLTSTVGGENPAHTTAIGKLLLSYKLFSEGDIIRWIGNRELVPRTVNSKTSPAELHAELVAIRQRGYSVDDQENERGINCLAVPAFLTSPTVPSGGVSISGLAYRTPLKLLVDSVEEIRGYLGPLGVPQGQTVGG